MKFPEIGLRLAPLLNCVPMCWCAVFRRLKPHNFCFETVTDTPCCLLRYKTPTGEGAVVYKTRINAYSEHSHKRRSVLLLRLLIVSLHLKRKWTLSIVCRNISQPNLISVQFQTKLRVDRKRQSRRPFDLALTDKTALTVAKIINQ